MTIPTIKKYLWRFGDGTSSTEKNPVHIYRMPGTYTVILYEWDTLDTQYLITKTNYIYVYDWWPEEGIDVSKTDYCLRHAIPQQPGQGKGWSEYNGDDWPYPEGKVGTCQIIDDNNELRQFVTDAITFKIYELGYPNQWKDGGNDQYGGSDFEAEILFRELQPPIRASAKLRHNESHVNIKPWFKSYRGQDGYDGNGLPVSFNADLFIRTDSSDEDRGVARQVPYQGQIVYDRHLESEFLQEGVRLRGAPWRLVSVDLWHEQIDTAASPQKKLMSEMTWGLELSEPVLWIPRSDRFLNFATGAELSGSYTAFSEGPDGYSRSAYTMGSSDTITTTLANQSGDFTLLVWLKNTSDPSDILTLSNLRIWVNLSGVNQRISWTDTSQEIHMALPNGFSEWSQVVLARSGGFLKLYYNGSLVNTYSMKNPNITYGGNAVIGGGTFRFSCLRIVPREVSANGVIYAYRDMDENNGNATEPVF